MHRRQGHSCLHPSECRTRPARARMTAIMRVQGRASLPDLYSRSGSVTSSRDVETQQLVMRRLLLTTVAIVAVVEDAAHVRIRRAPALSTSHSDSRGSGVKAPCLKPVSSLDVDLTVVKREARAFESTQLPILLTPDEAAAVIRTTRKGIYNLIARGQMPGVTRLGRRVLIRSRDLLDWLDRNCAPSTQERQR